MPQPAENDRDAADLVTLAAAAWSRVEVAVGRLADDPLHAQSRTLHRQIQAEVDGAMADLNADVEGWVADRLPTVATRGAAAGAADLPDVTIEGDLLNPEDAELRALARELTSKALSATRNVSESTRTLLRRVATDEVLDKLATGRTAVQAAARVEELMGRSGVFAVRYANGARHGLDDYAATLVRTVTARAYNAGTLGMGRRHGVGAAEVADGWGCTFPTGHGHAPEANGMLVSLELAETYPIAHPNCVRAYLLRPDVRDPAALDDGELHIDPSTTEAQRADQNANDLRRRQRVAVRARSSTAATRAARLDRRRRLLERRIANRST